MGVMPSKSMKMKWILGALVVLSATFVWGQALGKSSVSELVREAKEQVRSLDADFGGSGCSSNQKKILRDGLWPSSQALNVVRVLRTAHRHGVGIDTKSLEALERAAAQLPRLELRPFGADLPVLGKNTVAATETGVFWGYVGMIEGLLRRLRDEQGGGKDISAIATGGLAGLFAEHLSGITAVDPGLTVRGLFEIYARNRGLRGDKGN